MRGLPRSRDLRRTQCDERGARCDRRRARSPHADATDRRVLFGAESEGCTGEAAAVQRRVPWHRLEAVEFHPHAALHDVVVQAVHAAAGRQGNEHVGAAMTVSLG